MITYCDLCDEEKNCLKQGDQLWVCRECDVEYPAVDSKIKDSPVGVGFIQKDLKRQEAD